MLGQYYKKTKLHFFFSGGLWSGGFYPGTTWNIIGTVTTHNCVVTKIVTKTTHNCVVCCWIQNLHKKKLMDTKIRFRTLRIFWDKHHFWLYLVVWISLTRILTRFWYGEFSMWLIFGVGSFPSREFSCGVFSCGNISGHLKTMFIFMNIFKMLGQ